MADLTKQNLYNNILSLFVGLAIAFIIIKNSNDNFIVVRQYKKS